MCLRGQGWAEELDACLEGGFGHKDVGEDVDGDVGGEEPALEGRGESLRVGVEDEAGREEDYCGEEHIEGIAGDFEDTAAEDGDGVHQHSEAEEDFEEVLEGDVADVEPAVREGGGGDEKREEIEGAAASFVSECDGGEKGGEAGRDGGID